MDILSKIALPPEYRKRLLQGLGAWALLAVLLIGWIAWNSSAALNDISARAPQVSGPVKTVYLTPQITETQGLTFGGTGANDTAAVPAQGAYVSLIITDLGLTEDSTRRAIEDMPPEVALAFSPYGDLPRWIRQAGGAKHEALALLPMEPQSYPKDDPGPRALLTRVSDKANAESLAALMKDSGGAAGMMNFMGSEFLSNGKSLAPVFETLHKSGALFIEQRVNDKSVAAEAAAKAGLPYAPADIVIDASATETDVSQKLVELERLAKQRGYAVGIASPYPVSFNMIKSWSQNLEARGVRLIPLSAMMKVKARHDQGQQTSAQ